MRPRGEAPAGFAAGRLAPTPAGPFAVSKGAFADGNTILGIGVRAQSGGSIAGFKPTLRFDLDNDSYRPASAAGATDGRTSFGSFSEQGDFTVQFEGGSSWRGSTISVQAGSRSNEGTPEKTTYTGTPDTVLLPGGVGSGTSYDFAFRAFAQPAANAYQMFIDMTAIPRLYGSADPTSVYKVFFPNKAGVAPIRDRVTVSLNGLGTNNVVFGADLPLPSVDLDVDSNNDGAIDPDNGPDGTDDRIEDRYELPGVIVPVGGSRVKMIADVPQGMTATLAFAQGTDSVRVYGQATAGDPVLEKGKESTRIVGSGSPQAFWIEAFAPSASIPSVAFSLTLDVGTSSGSTSTPPRDLIRAKAVALDLDADSNNDGTIDPDNGPAGKDDRIEEQSPGRIIFANTDDDDRNGVADLLDVARVAGENDLTEIMLAAAPVIGSGTGSLIVTYDETMVRLYTTPDRTAAVGSGATVSAGSPFYAEGRAAGTSLVTVTYSVNAARVTDTVRLTVQPYPDMIDVDIDSDNSFLPPTRSEWEETLEDHPYGIGKLIMLDKPGRPVAPIVLEIAAGLPTKDPSLGVRIDWNRLGAAGEVRLWNTFVIDDFRNPAPVDQGGNRIDPGHVYSLADLKYNSTTGTIAIWAEGIRENERLKTLAGVEAAPRVDERIRGTLVVNGDDAAFDEVKYLVANEDSFYYALHTRQEVRNALASRGVYSFAPMPKFSLQPKSPKDLDLGDGDEFPLSPNVPGFKAMVYQDYITGDRQYVLAFGGTDDNNPFTDGDWANNLQQAIGRQAPQYTEAMKIANGLVEDSNIPKGQLVVSGHSLGGGLASAAAVVAGAHADTFNASWLNPGTLLTAVDNGTPVRVVSIDPLLFGYEIYPGALANLANARNTIDAYFVDYDILTRVQQVAFVALDRVLIAPVGSMTKLDSPYDVDMAVAGLPSFGTVAADIMLTCHNMNVVLYGLLVKEDTPTLDMLGYSRDDLRRLKVAPGQWL